MCQCPNCPRGSEAPGLDRDDVHGKWAGTRGRPTSPICLIGTAPGKDELLTGTPFTGGSGRMLKAALAYNNSSMDEVYALNRINCFPLGRGEVPTPDQLDHCRERFHRDLMASTARVLVPLGDIALKSLLAFKGKRQSISYWRGYTIPAAEATIPLPPSVKWIVPAYHPAFIMRGGNRAYPWLRVDIGTAVCAARGELKPLVPPASNSPWPAHTPPAFAFDIETEGLSGAIESISIAWEGRDK